MKWKGGFVFKNNNRRVFEYGVLDYIKLYALYAALVVGVVIGLTVLFFLNTFRWTI